MLPVSLYTRTFLYAVRISRLMHMQEYQTSQPSEYDSFFIRWRSWVKISS